MVDRAVYLWGATVLARWQERDKEGKRVYASLEQCMGLDPPDRPVNVAALSALAGVKVKR